MSCPLRVLHVIKALGRGGAEVLLREGHRVADAGRLELEYATLRDRPNDIAEDLVKEGAVVHAMGAKSDVALLLLSKRLSTLVRRRRIDVIHAHLPLSGVLARLAGWRAGVPVVYTEHNVETQYRWASRSLNRWTWRFQKRVIAVSKEVRLAIENQHGDQIPVDTVLNGVNVGEFRPMPARGSEIRAKLGVPSDAQVVGTVAVFRDTPQKRLDVWITAMSDVLQGNAERHALLVGDGPLRKELERQSAATGLGEQFHFVGRQADVRPYLAAMDVFVMSSSYEGLPVAPSEAMAMGLPVVSTDVSGVREVVRDDETGYLVPFDNHVVTNLADAVARLLDAPERRAEFGRRARVRVENHLSMQRMQRELEAIYRQVLEEWHSQRR